MSSNFIQEVQVKDLRFPTSLQLDGSDALHIDPDYSCAYVIITTNTKEQGFGLTFTLGRGTEIVVQAVKTLSPLFVGRKIDDIFQNFGNFWREITSESQIRWVGPEKGVLHLATAALINALWDLRGKMAGKPVWKLLCDMSPEEIVSSIDFRYITDVITKEEAIHLLNSQKANKIAREAELRARGYPAYTTQAGWLGYSEDKVKDLCKKYLNEGFDAFKVKVGQNLDNDRLRCQMVREVIGYDKTMMVDANQAWDVPEAIKWMKSLAEYKPLWIEEPTSPDDILGHKAVAEALEPYGIGVATGEMASNRVIFKQLLQSKAIEFCQIDSCRLGGVNEILSVYLMAYKLGIKVVPHAGGIGLCEMVQHLQMWDYVSLTGTTESRWIEYVDQQHEHFKYPTIVIKGFYQVPTIAGYSTELKPEALASYEYPNGNKWKELFASGKYKDPKKENN